MKIRSLTVEGFRGFNEQRTIEFSDRLTLIYAPNSYGKTSISEALEWLLYGVTSKVERADSKDEYRGCYRNRHFPEASFPCVSARLVDGCEEITLTGELMPDDTFRRQVTKSGICAIVSEWPIEAEMRLAPRPFILQHALKYLLLAKPDDRFQGFARLLGLETLDEIHKNIIALCTAPEGRLPREVRDLLQTISSLRKRVSDRKQLSALHRAVGKKEATLLDIYAIVASESRKRLPSGTDEASLLPQLLAVREDAVGKLFRGHVALAGYTGIEKQASTEDEAFLVGCLTQNLIEEYAELLGLGTLEQILMRATFLGMGTGMLKSRPGKCPLCGQPVDGALEQHIHAQHEDLAGQAAQGDRLRNQRASVVKTLAGLRERLVSCHERHRAKVEPFLRLVDSLPQLEGVLTPRYQKHYQNVADSLSVLSDSTDRIAALYKAAIGALDIVTSSIESSQEDIVLMRTLGDSLTEYVSATREHIQLVEERSGMLSDADKVLQHELDAIAGTEDISLLVEFIDQRAAVGKCLEIERILGGLKELRRSADVYVANRVLEAISGEWTATVMGWYDKIKTTGDPEVHFGGFDLERTQKGDVRARRVKIRATSYGQELVSAVSSLSESKLNALGLCLSIATNLKGRSPFEFLVIDDPIQSLDAQHETQFVQIIRALVEDCQKQVILLSHNRAWLREVCAGCRALNGWFYEITGYTQAGPHISAVVWENWQQRLKVVNAILADPNAGTTQLQQAEEEIRIVVADVTCELYRRTRGKQRSPHSLNSAQVRAILTECGVKQDLVDRTVQTFCTTDDSHHAPAGYCPDRERIRTYHSWAHELAALLK